MFEYYEIIKILILITSFCAPSDVLVYVFAVFPVFFFFFPSFGNPAKERCGRYSETITSANTFIVGFTVFCLFEFFFLD